VESKSHMYCISTCARKGEYTRADKARCGKQVAHVLHKYVCADGEYTRAGKARCGKQVVYTLRKCVRARGGWHTCCRSTCSEQEDGASAETRKEGNGEGTARS
jgi:hypothetical protein